MTPIKAPTVETLEFVERHLPVRDARLLEVGCGRGELAAELSARGVRVQALDTSSEAVTEARARGVNVVHQDFLAYEGEPFDLILFSRSLHHIHAPLRAIKHANALLKASGILLIDDFGVDLADRRSAVWRYEVEALLELAGLFDSDEEAPDSLFDPLARWQAEHASHHHIADSITMRKAVERDFEIIAEERAPYLYRYIVERLEASARGFLIAEYICGWEKRLIEAGKLQPIGIRWVARSRR